MQIFSNLNLDDEDQDFLDSSRASKFRRNAINSKFDADVGQETLMTNFDDELDQMEI